MAVNNSCYSTNKKYQKKIYIYEDKNPMKIFGIKLSDVGLKTKEKGKEFLQPIVL